MIHARNNTDRLVIHVKVFSNIKYLYSFMGVVFAYVKLRISFIQLNRDLPMVPVRFLNKAGDEATPIVIKQTDINDRKPGVVLFLSSVSNFTQLSNPCFVPAVCSSSSIVVALRVSSVQHSTNTSRFSSATSHRTLAIPPSRPNFVFMSTMVLTGQMFNEN